jgi:hypothetical protein
MMKTDDGKKQSIAVIKSLSEEIFRALDTDKQGTLDWVEFKKFGTINKAK